MKTKIFKNKLAKGLVSLITIIIFLSSILAASIYYENNITANVIKEISIDQDVIIQIKEVNEIKELTHLNEGWYEIRNGHVFYLETFDSAVPLYIKIKNPQQQNGLLVVDADGNIKFEENVWELAGNRVSAVTEEITQNQITGLASGLEAISGMQGAQQASGVLPEFTGNLKNVPKEDFLRTIKFSKNDEEGNYYAINNDDQKIFIPKDGSIMYYNVKSGQGEEIWIRTTGTQRQQIGLSDLPDTYFTLSGTPKPAATPPPGAESRETPAVVAEAPTPQPQQQTFNFKILDKDGNVIEESITVPASSKQEAKDTLLKEYEEAYYKIYDATATPTSIGIETKELRNNKISLTYNGKYIGTYAKDSAELNNAKKEVENFEKLKKNNPKISDDELVNTYFKYNQYADKDAAVSVFKKLGFEVDIVQALTTTEEEVPYTIKFLNDGRRVYNYKGREIVTDNDEVPQELQDIIDFEKKHPNADLKEELRTLDNEKVYLENGRYIDETGKQINSFIKKETIGKKEYEVVHDIKNGKIIPTAIKIDGKPAQITEIMLNTLQNYGDVDGSLKVNENKHLTFSFTKIRAVSKNKEEISAVNVEFFDRGPTETISTDVVDNKGNILSSTEIKRESSEVKTTATGESRYTVGLITEKIYERKKGEKSIDKARADYREITKDAVTGEPTAIEIKEGGAVYKARYDGKKVVGDPKAEDRLNTLRRQHSFRRTIVSIERIFTEFRGLGYIPSIFGDEELANLWRDDVDRFFATTVFGYLDADWRASKICENYIDGEQKGIAYAETPQGLAQVAAHIEATRTKPIDTGKGTEYIYKITFNVRNGDYEKDPRAPEEMKINVFIARGDKRIDLFKQDKQIPIIKRGSSFGRTGSNAIVKQSNLLYNEVCIRFDKIPLKWRLKKVDDKWELCNKVQEVSGEPTKLQQEAERRRQQQEPEINPDW